jgi:hypothetical protein
MLKNWNQYTGPNLAIDAFLDKATNYTGDDCLLWQFGTNESGYACTHSHRIRKQYGTQSVSRIVCIEVYGPPPTPKHESGTVAIMAIMDA